MYQARSSRAVYQEKHFGQQLNCLIKPNKVHNAVQKFTIHALLANIDYYAPELRFKIQGWAGSGRMRREDGVASAASTVFARCFGRFSVWRVGAAVQTLQSTTRSTGGFQTSEYYIMPLRLDVICTIIGGDSVVTTNVFIIMQFTV